MSTQTIKAIETQYKGYRFRSRLEARWAVFFDTLGIAWEYEKEGYDLGDAGWYLPDFWLPEQQVWVEVKGDEISETDTAKVNALRALSEKDVLVFSAIPQSMAQAIKWNCGWSGAKASASILDQLQSRHIQEMIGDNNGSFGAQLRCPVCGGEWVHIGDATNYDGKDGYQARPVWDGRGDAVCIPMWCENGDEWVVRYGFHKGNSYINIQQVMMWVDNFFLFAEINSTTSCDDAFAAARSARFEHGESGVSQ